MPLDPLAKEGVGYLDFQGIALATEPKMHPVPKPESKPGFTKLLGHRRSQSWS